MKNLAKIAILGVLTIFLVASAAIAQSGNGTDTLALKSTSNNIDQSLRSTAQVNPSTLALEFSIPFATYPGRAGNSASAGIEYSSKAWRGESTISWWYPVNTQTKYVTDVYSRYAEKSAAGWTGTLSPPRIDTRSEIYTQYGQIHSDNITDEGGMNSGWLGFLQNQTQSLMMPCGSSCAMWVWDCPGQPIGSQCPMSTATVRCVSRALEVCDLDTDVPYDPPEAPPSFNLYYIKRVNVLMPNGSSVEFRADDQKHLCGTNLTGCTKDLTGTFLSVDGSGMRLERDANGSTLHMPNGSVYLFPSSTPSPPDGIPAAEFRDRNGNRQVFSTVGTGQEAVSEVRDTNGRVLEDPLPQGWQRGRRLAGDEQVEYPSMAGGTLSYKLTWLFLKPMGCEASSDPNCLGANGAAQTSEGALLDPTQKLGFDGKYFCRGSISEDLTAQYPNDVLFGQVEPGVRSCSSFDLQKDSQGNIVTDTEGNGIPYPARFNPVVLAKVELPNGNTYEFKYNRYGEIARIIYPSGSYEEFDYSWIQPIGQPISSVFNQTNRGVTERRQYDSAGVLQQITTYEVSFDELGTPNASYEIETRVTRGTRDENENIVWGARSVRSLHIDNGDSPFGFGDPLAGRERESRSYDENGALRSRSFSYYKVKGPLSGGEAAASRDARLEKTVSMVFEPGQAKALASRSQTVFDENGSADARQFAHLNAIRTESYKYKAVDASAYTETVVGWTTLDTLFSSAPKASIAETDFAYDANYLADGIVGLAVETKVLNPADSSVLARTQTVYDNLLPAPDAGAYTADENWGMGGTQYDCGSGVPCWEENTSPRKGRASTVRLWDDDNQVWIKSHTEYDIFGNAVRTKDHAGRESRVVFNSAYKYAYPVESVAPAPGDGSSGTDQEFRTTTTYDLATGLVLSATDLGDLTTSADDLVSTTEYNDPMLRPTAVVAPNGARTETVYNDVPGDMWVRTRSQFDANVWKEATSHLDSLGRVVRTVRKDAQGDVASETKYDLLGRTRDVSNPYRLGANGGPAQGQTVLWTRTEYDAAGRVETIRTPVAAPNTIAGDPTGTRTYGIADGSGPNGTTLLGTWVVATDASGRRSRSVTNSLGQLERVDEPTSFGGTIDQDLGPVSAPLQPTFYKYDVKGNMVEVTQGVQKRNFLYDSLGRLIRVRQPEQEVNASLAKTDPVTGNSSWTAGFSYDVLGRLVRSTDARGVNIVNEYDNADRVLKRCYSKENFQTTASTCAGLAGNLHPTTTEVSYKYDLINGQIANSKGALIETSNGVSTSRTSAIDQFGRPTEYQQITNGTTYTSKYAYNLSGALIEEEYPSGRKVRNDFDENGELSRIHGQNGAASTARTFANSLNYFPDGRIEKLRLGNGLWESSNFNERLQVTMLGLGRGPEDASDWRLEYGYDETLPQGGSANTGNVVSQTITARGIAKSFVQTYKYDALYRITEARETNDGAQQWIENYGYDRYGNRTTFAQNLEGSQLALNSLTHPTISQTTNRFNTGQGYLYDKAGNLTTDVDEYGNVRITTFDADSKQTKITSGSPQQTNIGEYFYDGNGKRVKKIVYDSNGQPTETVVFVYSGGKLVAEYSSKTPPQGAEAQTKYVATDMLGSVRAVTNQNGEIVSRRDFLPFGKELPNSSTPGHSNSLRTSAAGYGSDNIRQKFTGYQKDEETGLDFAEARMYENRHGRFTAVDPLLASGFSRNPQTNNRYSYVSNRPFAFRDPTGLVPCPPDKQCVTENGEEIILDDGPPIEIDADSNNIVPGCGGSNDPGCPESSGPTQVLTTVGGAGAATALKPRPPIQPVTRPPLTLVPNPSKAPTNVPRFGPKVTPRFAISAALLGAGVIILMLPSEVQAPVINQLDDKTSQARRRDDELRPDFIIVRGGISEIPPPGTVFSGSFGASIEDAARFVPHNQIRFTTVKAIIEAGGTVIIVPEFTRGENLNLRHVNVVLIGPSPFSALMPNPVPKSERLQE
ncbi:MAG: RHS repeat-associated core domain-containing protein [Pyrinomonadaceae bacterium]